MTISRMQNPQQLQGIGSLRQPYGLGKLVKKAFKGVKKVLKSPLGKAALMYAATAGLGSLGSGLTGFQRFAPSNFMGNLGRIGGFLTGKGGAAKTGLGKWFGGLTGGQKIFTGLATAGVAAPFIQKLLKWGPYKEKEEEEDWSVTPGSIANLRNQALDYYRSDTPDYLGSPFMVPKKYVQENYLLSADGGRVGLLNGGEAGEAQMEQMLRAEYLKYRNQGGTMPYEQFKMLVMKQAQQGQAPNQMMADGGRMGFQEGGWHPGVGRDESGYLSDHPSFEGGNNEPPVVSGGGNTPVVEPVIQEGYNWKNIFPGGKPFYANKYTGYENVFGTKYDPITGLEIDDDDTTISETISNKIRNVPALKTKIQTTNDILANMMKNESTLRQDGGRIGAQEGGLMDLGGQEKDYRENGGFVPLGEEERADDVPARLSKNEFVFTADAVRAAGGGDIDAGSEVMQNVMDNLEQGGEVSEESQGQNPAQGMYNNYEQLQSRVA